MPTQERPHPSEGATAVSRLRSCMMEIGNNLGGLQKQLNKESPEGFSPTARLIFADIAMAYVEALNILFNGQPEIHKPDPKHRP